MSIKSKLTSAIMSFILVLSLLSVGVYALNQAEVILGGNLTFSATGVYAEVKGSVANAVMPEGQDAEYAPLLFSTDNTEPNQTSWQKTLGFDGTNDIVLTINIENKANDRKLYVAITDTADEVVNVTKTVKQGENDCLNTCIEVDAGDTAEIKITFHLKNVNLSLAEQSLYGYKIELNKDEIITEEIYTETYWNEKGLLFEEIASTSSQSVSTAETMPELYVYADEASAELLEGADLVIPRYILRGETRCIITQIGENGNPGECNMGFYGTNIKSVFIPGTIKLVGSYSFYYITTLESVILQDGVRMINSTAFSGCSGITQLVIPDSVTAVLNSVKTFSSATSLVWTDSANGIKYLKAKDSEDGEVNEYYAVIGLSDGTISERVIHSGTKLIDEYLFEGNGNINSITLPDSLISICEYAFSSCALSNVTYTGTKTQWSDLLENINLSLNNTLNTATITCSDGVYGQ